MNGKHPDNAASLGQHSSHMVFLCMVELKIATTETKTLPFLIFL